MADVDLDALEQELVAAGRDIPYAAIGETHLDTLNRLRNAAAAKAQLLTATPALIAELHRLRTHRAELREWLADRHDCEMDAGGKWSCNDYAYVTNFLDEQDQRPRRLP